MRFSAITALLVLSATTVLACDYIPSVRYEVSLDDGECDYRISQYEGIQNISRFVDVPSYLLKCKNRNLSTPERRALMNITEKYNKEEYSNLADGAVHVVEQSGSEYRELREEAERVNDQRCKCLKYREIQRYPELGWTVYARDSICYTTGGACRLQKPRGCETDTDGGVLNYLIGLPGLVLAGFLFLGLTLILRRMKKFV